MGPQQYPCGTEKWRLLSMEYASPTYIWNFWVSGTYQTKLGHFLWFQIYIWGGLLSLMMPSSNSAGIHKYPYWLTNPRWCRLLCASGHYIIFFSCTLPTSFFMAYVLFIEQDLGTDFYITESHSIYAFSSLFNIEEKTHSEDELH